MISKNSGKKINVLFTTVVTVGQMRSHSNWKSVNSNRATSDETKLDPSTIRFHDLDLRGEYLIISEYALGSRMESNKFRLSSESISSKMSTEKLSERDHIDDYVIAMKTLHYVMIIQDNDTGQYREITDEDIRKKNEDKMTNKSSSSDPESDPSEECENPFPDVKKFPVNYDISIVMKYNEANKTILGSIQSDKGLCGTDGGDSSNYPQLVHFQIDILPREKFR